MCSTDTGHRSVTSAGVLHKSSTVAEETDTSLQSSTKPQWEETWLIQTQEGNICSDQLACRGNSSKVETDKVTAGILTMFYKVVIGVKVFTTSSCRLTNKAGSRFKSNFTMSPRETMRLLCPITTYC